MTAETIVTEPERIDCQHADCEDAADFMVVDTADRDPYSAFVYACEAHCGALMGHAMHVSDADQTAHFKGWIVSPLSVRPDDTDDQLKAA